jgi:hypothetical protein
MRYQKVSLLLAREVRQILGEFIEDEPLVTSGARPCWKLCGRRSAIAPANLLIAIFDAPRAIVLSSARLWTRSSSAPLHEPCYLLLVQSGSRSTRTMPISVMKASVEEADDKATRELRLDNVDCFELFVEILVGRAEYAAASDTAVAIFNSWARLFSAAELLLLNVRKDKMRKTT